MAPSRRSPETTADNRSALRTPAWTAASPPAARVRVTRWRDPRLWLGLVLVLAATLFGAKLFAAADDTVQVWAADRGLVAGMPLSRGDLAAQRVHFNDPSEVARYLATNADLPAEAHLSRDVGAGELLPRAAIATEADAALLRLPIGLRATSIPVGLRAGDRVDVWATPQSAGDRAPSARLVLSEVVVVSLGDQGPGGVSGEQQVLLGIKPETNLAPVLAVLAGADVVLVQRGG